MESNLEMVLQSVIYKGEKNVAISGFIIFKDSYKNKQ